MKYLVEVDYHDEHHELWCATEEALEFLRTVLSCNVEIQVNVIPQED